MIVFKDYPYWNPQTLQDVIDMLRQITNIRKDDIDQINTLNNSFITLSKTGRIPTASNNVDVTDRLGDFNVAEDGGTFYFYYLVDDSGTVKWLRSAFSTF